MEEWPISRETDVKRLPERYAKIVLAADGKEIDTLANRIGILFSRCSKIGLLLNATARLLNLYKRYKGESDGSKVDTKKTPELTEPDIEPAETFCILEAHHKRSERREVYQVMSEI